MGRWRADGTVNKDKDMQAKQGPSEAVDEGHQAFDKSCRAPSFAGISQPLATRWIPVCAKHFGGNQKTQALLQVLHHSFQFMGESRYRPLTSSLTSLFKKWCKDE